MPQSLHDLLSTVFFFQKFSKGGMLRMLEMSARTAFPQWEIAMLTLHRFLGTGILPNKKLSAYLTTLIGQMQASVGSLHEILISREKTT